MVTAPAALLIVMAHPDDPERWAGGTIARHVEAGGTVTIAVAVAKHDPVRAAEAEAGARILGANLYLLDDVAPYAIDALLAKCARTSWSRTPLMTSILSTAGARNTS